MITFALPYYILFVMFGGYLLEESYSFLIKYSNIQRGEEIEKKQKDHRWGNLEKNEKNLNFYFYFSLGK